MVAAVMHPRLVMKTVERALRDDGYKDRLISSRYVHPSEDAVLGAMARLGGHKIGHSRKSDGFWRGAAEAANSIKTNEKNGGQCRARTCDLLLVSYKSDDDSK